MSQVWWLLADGSLRLSGPTYYLSGSDGSPPSPGGAKARPVGAPERAGAARAQPRPPLAPQGRASLRPPRSSVPWEGNRGEPAAAPRREGAGGDGAVGVSGFLQEPVSGEAAGGPGHVMPGPGGGQARDPVAAGRRGGSGAAPAPRRSHTAGSAAAAPPPWCWLQPCSRRALAAERAPSRLRAPSGREQGRSASLRLRRLRGAQLQVSALWISIPRVSLQLGVENLGHHT